MNEDDVLGTVVEHANESDEPCEAQRPADSGR